MLAWVSCSSAQFWSNYECKRLFFSFFFFFSPLKKEIESGKIIFPEHIPLSKLQQGIKSGIYLQGTYRASRENYLEATVWVHGDAEENKEVSVLTSHCEFYLVITEDDYVIISQW